MEGISSSMVSWKLTFPWHRTWKTDIRCVWLRTDIQLGWKIVSRGKCVLLLAWCGRHLIGSRAIEQKSHVRPSGFLLTKCRVGRSSDIWCSSTILWFQEFIPSFPWVSCVWSVKGRGHHSPCDWLNNHLNRNGVHVGSFALLGCSTFWKKLHLIEERSVGSPSSSVAITSSARGLAQRIVMGGPRHRANRDGSPPPSLVGHVDSPTAKGHFSILLGPRNLSSWRRKRLLFRGWERSASWARWQWGSSDIIVTIWGQILCSGSVLCPQGRTTPHPPIFTMQSPSNCYF